MRAGAFRISQQSEIMSEAEDYLVKITGRGGALCPSFRDRHPRVPRGAAPPTGFGVRVYSDVRTGQDFRPPRNRMIKNATRRDRRV
jgi:hypothetical protein